jgi:hypothetical protein
MSKHKSPEQKLHVTRTKPKIKRDIQRTDVAPAMPPKGTNADNQFR